MGIKDVRDLDVYQKAFEISIDLHKHTLDFPKIEQYALADQMRRASKSVCANLAEGFAKQFDSNAEYKRFILISLASANEVRVWLDYAQRLEYLSGSEKYKHAYDEICRMLRALHQSRSRLDAKP